MNGMCGRVHYLPMLSKGPFMSSVTDLKNLSAGDLTSRSPEETSILYLFFFSFVSISFVGLVYDPFDAMIVFIYTECTMNNALTIFT